MGMGNIDDFLDGVDGAEDVADGGAGQEAGARREHLLQGHKVEMSVVSDGTYLNYYARARLQELPWNNI